MPKVTVNGRDCSLCSYLSKYCPLFAGAGIVEASRPQAEHAETAAKFRTVLDGLHISPDQLPR